LTHRGGDAITWSDYSVSLNGSTVTTESVQTSVGESADFVHHFDPISPNDLAVNEKYVVRVIDIDDQMIVWEDDITAKAA